MIPKEWVPTFIGAGILAVFGIGLDIWLTIEAKRKRKSGSSKP